MKFDFTCVTLFRRQVYEALLKVPEGRVTTYGRLAGYIGCKSARAVGQALRNNPFAPDVPCHRVIAADLTSGGFDGERGGAKVRKKLALLEQEGVLFGSDGRLVNRDLLWP